MTKQSIHNDLSHALLKQDFDETDVELNLICKYKQIAKSYSQIDNSVAVLSDYQNDKSYIYSSDFGETFGFASLEIESAFEDDIFQKIHHDDIIERHILDLRYFQFQKNIEQNNRRKYNTESVIRMRNLNNEYKYIRHRTFYLKSKPNGSVWLSLCLYSPIIEQHQRRNIEGRIVDNVNGKIISIDDYKQYDKTILTKREISVLKLIAKGLGSKQVANELFVSVHTVYRHRQNIISKMKVANTAEAIKTAIAMDILDL